MSTRSYLCCIAALAAVMLWPRLASADERHALIIGANPGWSDDRPLSYAERDAERVRDVLTGLGGFAPDRVTLLRDPSTADVRGALRRLHRIAEQAQDDTLFFIYYSGHADEHHLHLRGPPLTHIELARTLEGLPATVTVAVVDACKSGSVTRKGGAPAESFNVDVRATGSVRGLVMLTSSGADELSQESRTLTGSVFTHHLVSALRGAADEDGSGAVTLAEAYRYAHARTIADTSGTSAPQRPAFRFDLRGQGDLTLTTVAARHARISVPRGPGSRYVVLDDHEWRVVAEARAQAGREVAIAVAPGSYRIKRVSRDRIDAGRVTLKSGDTIDAGAIRYAAQPLAHGIVKGSPELLTPQERREWRRGRGFRLLADGEAAPALREFDSILREAPDDVLAWRGRGRALVRLAESYQKLGDHATERRVLTDALAADPSLSDDPLFQSWYQRLTQLEARAQASGEQKLKLQQSIARNPRRTKRYGLGFDLISSRGMMAVAGSFVVERMWFPRVAVDLAGPGFDLGVTVAPFNSRWSPFFGVGGHVSLAQLGIDAGGEGMVEIGESSHSYDELYGKNLHFEAGAQFMGKSGFSSELGLSAVLFENKDGEVDQTLMPIINLGWYW